MRKLSKEKRVMILKALVEGNSVNSTTRLCGVSKLTVLRLLNDVGSLCRDFHDLTVRGLACRRVQVDEIWSFCYAKQKNVPEDKQDEFGYGDCWTWTALDSDSKLIVSYYVGLRDAGYATEFIRDVADRIDSKIQLTSDGHRAYLSAVEDAFGGEVDYAQLVKLYGAERKPEARYSPAICIGARISAVSGNPDPNYVSTSHVERANLTLRMGNRRFTRLTNGFSKKWVNHEHAISLHYFHYNFCRVHQTIKTTPAVAAGITDKIWTISDLVDMLEREERLREKGGRINRQDRK